MPINAPVEAGHTFATTDVLTASLLNKALELARAVIPTPFGTSNGGTGATSVVNAQKNLQILGRLEAWVEYTDDGAAVLLGTLPADSFIVNVMVHITTAFNGTGTDLVSVGWTADVDAIGVAQDVSSTGVTEFTHGANDGYNSSSQTLNAYYVDANGDASAGKALIVVTYAQVTTQP